MTPNPVCKLAEMALKIVGGGDDGDDSSVNTALVELLESALEMARRGEIVGMAAAFLGPNREHLSGYAHRPDEHDLLALYYGVDVLKRELFTEDG